MCSKSFDASKPNWLQLLGATTNNNLYLLRCYTHHTFCSCLNYVYILLATLEIHQMCSKLQILTVQKLNSSKTKQSIASGGLHPQTSCIRVSLLLGFAPPLKNPRTTPVICLVVHERVYSGIQLFIFNLKLLHAVYVGGWKSAEPF